MRSYIRAICLFGGLAALIDAAYCDPALPIGAPAIESAQKPSFATARIAIRTDTQTIPIRVELATTYAQRSLGLMNRARLPADRGMLFLYPEPQSPLSGFWMFHTRIPLDIAFLGRRGVILGIKSMTPCASSDPLACRVYAAGVAYTAALEVNQGFFAAHRISRGDQVVLPVAQIPPE